MFILANPGLLFEKEKRKQTNKTLHFCSYRQTPSNFLYSRVQLPGFHQYHNIQESNFDHFKDNYANTSLACISHVSYSHVLTPWGPFLVKSSTSFNILFRMKSYVRWIALPSSLHVLMYTIRMAACSLQSWPCSLQLFLPLAMDRLWPCVGDLELGDVLNVSYCLYFCFIAPSLEPSSFGSFNILMKHSI